MSRKREGNKKHPLIKNKNKTPSPKKIEQINK
jgi:hypothetical protein